MLIVAQLMNPQHNDVSSVVGKQVINIEQQSDSPLFKTARGEQAKD